MLFLPLQFHYSSFFFYIRVNDNVFHFKIHENVLNVFFLGFVFSSCFGIIIVITYHALFSFILRIMPRSFSYGNFFFNFTTNVSVQNANLNNTYSHFILGEASIVTQGIVIFLMNFYMKMIVVAKKTTDCIRVTSSISCVMYSNSFWAINLTNTHHMSEMEQLTTILQVSKIIKNLFSLI